MPSTLPIVAVSATRCGVPGARLGNAMPHETISLELSSTGLSVTSSEASALRTDGVVGIFMCVPLVPWNGLARGEAADCGPPQRRDSSCYALIPFIVLWTMTSPSVTLGGF